MPAWAFDMQKWDSLTGDPAHAGVEMRLTLYFTDDELDADVVLHPFKSEADVDALLTPDSLPVLRETIKQVVAIAVDAPADTAVVNGERFEAIDPNDIDIDALMADTPAPIGHAASTPVIDLTRVGESVTVEPGGIKSTPSDEAE